MKNLELQRKASAARKARRIAAGICYLCGKHPAEDGKKSCAACRAKRQAYETQYRKDHPEKFSYDVKTITADEAAVFEKLKPNRKKKKPKYTLDELCRMAKERGVSYGLLVTQISE